MKKEIMTSLSTLGVLAPSLANAMPLSDKTTVLGNLLDDKMSIVYEKQEIHPETMATVREIASHAAFLVDDETGVIYINLAQLPNELRDNLVKSSEITEVPNSHLVKMDQVFANILAKQGIFKKTETLEGIVINEIMLERLNEQSSPLLREELDQYLTLKFLVAKRIMKATIVIFSLVFTTAILYQEEEKRMSEKNTLTVSLKTNGIVPYREEAPVHELFAVLNPVLGQLLYVNQNYDLTPGLLESFHWEHKNSQYVLKIQDNLKFHNGREVTAKDLEFSLLRGFFTSQRNFFRAFFNNIEGIEEIKGKKKFNSGMVRGVKVMSDRIVTVKLKKPDPSFLHSLNRPSFSIVPREALEESNYESWKDGPVGAGNYQFMGLDSKNNITLKKISSNSQGADFIKINFSQKKYDSDIKVSDYQEDDEYRMTSSEKSTAVTNIFFNYNSTWGGNLDFRRAVHHAINRGQLVEGILMFKEARQFLASHFWGRIETKNDYSPEAARNILNKLGFSDKKQTFKIPVFAMAKRSKKLTSYLEILKRQFSQAGIKVDFIDSNNKFFSKSDKETPFRIMSLGADIADPIILFELMRGDDSPLWPHFPPNDKMYESLIDTASRAEILNVKISATQKLSQYFYDNKISIPLFEKKIFVSVKKDRVKSIGKQDGGLTFYLDRVELRGYGK